MAKAVSFTWLSIAAFKRLSPFEKEAYLREIVTHLADRLVEEAKPRLRKSAQRNGKVSRSASR